MTIHLTIKPITEWLFAAAGCLIIIGPLLAMLTGSWLELGALVPWYVCWILALIVALLAVGSLL